MKESVNRFSSVLFKRWFRPKILTLVTQDKGINKTDTQILIDVRFPKHTKKLLTKNYFALKVEHTEINEKKTILQVNHILRQ